MNYLLGILLGYIIHDALEPTAVGKILNEVSFPANTFARSEITEAT